MRGEGEVFVQRMARHRLYTGKPERAVAHCVTQPLLSVQSTGASNTQVQIPVHLLKSTKFGKRVRHPTWGSDHTIMKNY